MACRPELATIRKRFEVWYENPRGTWIYSRAFSDKFSALDFAEKENERNAKGYTHAVFAATIHTERKRC